MRDSCRLLTLEVVLSTYCRVSRAPVQKALPLDVAYGPLRGMHSSTLVKQNGWIHQ